MMLDAPAHWDTNRRKVSKDLFFLELLGGISCQITLQELMLVFHFVLFVHLALSTDESGAEMFD